MLPTNYELLLVCQYIYIYTCVCVYVLTDLFLGCCLLVCARVVGVHRGVTRSFHNVPIHIELHIFEAPLR